MDKKIIKMGLYRPIYEELSVIERKSILKQIADTHNGFSFKRFEKFERFGQSTDTAVYEFENSEFVFVPGDTVTLGWESFSVGIDDNTRQDMTETLAEYGINNLDSFLKENMSPVRTVRIKPMLVERNIHDIGWRRVPLNSIEILENQEFQKKIREFSSSTCEQYILDETLRLQKNDAEIIVDLYDAISYHDFIMNVIRSGFRLPTEDEWEYLCGGGSRTLFRWGDSFDYEMHVRHFAEVTPVKTAYDLQQPNQFGISIAYDPYQYEVLMDSKHFLKGGDGGCYICGGAGLALGYLPVSTYFRDINIDDSYYEADIGGDFTFYRRIIRL